MEESFNHHLLFVIIYMPLFLSIDYELLETRVDLFNKYLLIKQCVWSKGTMVEISGYDVTDVTGIKSGRTVTELRFRCLTLVS